MTAKRILILGIPGVQTSRAATRLSEELQAIGHDFEVVNFERDFLWGDDGREKATFLGSSIHGQHDRWETAWAQLKKRLDEAPDRSYLLSMHGCYISKHYGARCVFEPGVVARDFNPQIIFTLITDIYDAWTITHRKAAGIALKGDPRLSHLLMARRAELLVGDQIALASKSSSTSQHVGPKGNRKYVRNLLLSAYHPVQTFLNAVNSPDSFHAAYLSFPISQPRELENDGDKSAREVISQFVAAAFALQHHSRKLVVQCPLGIDEIPFVRALSSDTGIEESKPTQEDEFVLQFDRDNARWGLKELLGRDTMLVEPPDTLELFSTAQFHEASGMIRADVTFRDFRLVEQATFIAAFNPIIAAGRENMARSVREEIRRAISCQAPVYLFQDAVYDPKHRVLNELEIAPESRGTMEGESSKDFIIVCNSRDELLRNISHGGKV